MKINNIFYSLQGEGRYAGYPAIFIRTSGCNLNCEYCDTNYEGYVEINPMEMTKKIQKHLKKNPAAIIVFTGGEPTLQLDEIIEIMNIWLDMTKNDIDFEYPCCHIETNGTLNEINMLFTLFEYVVFSPKTLKTTKRICEYVNQHNWLEMMYDIKIVTDGENLNKQLIPYATMLMPVTTFNKTLDMTIKRKVWELCKEEDKIYSPRLHVDLFGKQRGV